MTTLPGELKVDAIIVGAGIAGLGMACALARWDVRVLLIERRARTGGIHRGDSLLPKATAMLQRWGVLDAIVAADAQPVGRLEFHHPTRGELFRTPLTGDADPTPYLVLPHAEIERVMMERAMAHGHVTLARPARVVGVIDEPRTGRICGVRFKIDDQLHEAFARVVIAADGHKSLVRRAMDIGGYAHPYDHAYLGLEADRPEGYTNAMRVHLHPEGGVLVMPRVERVGLGVLVNAGSASEWLALSDEQLSARLSERAPLLRGVRLYRQGAHVYELTRAHADRYAGYGAVLIGDAAHVTNPTAGQGMAMALTDVGALADRLGPVLARPEGAVQRALEAYERVQWPANEAIIRASHRLARAYAMRGPRWHAARTSFLALVGGRIGGLIARPIIQTFLRQKSEQNISNPPSTPSTSSQAA